MKTLSASRALPASEIVDSGLKEVTYEDKHLTGASKHMKLIDKVKGAADRPS